MREAAGKSIEDVTFTGIMSRSKLHRIESGRSVVKQGDVLALARLYGADLTKIDDLLALADGTKATVECGYLFVFIGAEPRTDWLGTAVARDEKGFVYTGPDLLSNGTRPKGWDRERDPFYLECSVPGIFAAGDVRANSVKRVASAVGEGAMAVTLVHRYLEAQ